MRHRCGKTRYDKATLSERLDFSINLITVL